MSMSDFIYQTGEGSFVVDVKVLLAKFEDGSLKKMADGDSLYNYFTEEEVDAFMSNLKNQYQGRYLAINSALGIVDLAASKNIKLDYDWGGGHVEVTDVDHVAKGTDCSAFVSWAINQGTPDTFTTRTTGGLINVGKTIDYKDAKEGDILVYNTSDSGHVVMIVENNPEKETFIVVEANGSNQGVILKTRTYASLRSSNYKAKDLTELYEKKEEESE
jgi:cell wall-associated NlpC family hydrolase